MVNVEAKEWWRYSCQMLLLEDKEEETVLCIGDLVVVLKDMTKWEVVGE